MDQANGYTQVKQGGVRMQPNLDGWSIVVAGHWNFRILRPEWIIEHLTDSKNVGIEIPISNPSLPPRFRFDDLILRADGQRLVVSPESTDESVLQRVELVARKVLLELPHTPVTATGVNFQFVEKEPDADLLRIFKVEDTAALADGGFSVQATSIQRRLESTNGILNLTATLSEDSDVVMDFNFHLDVTFTHDAADFLDSAILGFQDRACRLLDEVYASSWARPLTEGDEDGTE